MVKLRLQRKGRKKRPFYHIVIADSRAKRDGRYIERIGSYNPMTKPATITLDADSAFEWMKKGAQPTDTVRAILRLKGVMYRKHLMQGVAKGAMTEEQATAKYEAWVAAKDVTLAARKAEAEHELAAWHAKRNGTPPPAPVVVVEEVIEVVEEAPAPVVEETPVVEAPVVEETPTADDNKEA
jgi:small subunit ribosomal protein S16